MKILNWLKYLVIILTIPIHWKVSSGRVGCMGMYYRCSCGYSGINWDMKEHITELLKSKKTL